MTTTASAICAASESSQRPHRAPACRVNVQLNSTSALQRGMLPYFAFRPWWWHRLEANSISFPMVYCETGGSAEKLVKKGSKSVVNSTILFAFLQPMSVAVMYVADFRFLISDSRFQIDNSTIQIPDFRFQTPHWPSQLSNEPLHFRF